MTSNSRISPCSSKRMKSIALEVLAAHAGAVAQPLAHLRAQGLQAAHGAHHDLEFPDQPLLVETDE
ncbi:hypothetical protein, partial [Escherichia coli]|uniref:hypothetical protein n=1 Tax=Escherichia coli TaxID=562 RepID=UPI001BC87556